MKPENTILLVDREVEIEVLIIKKCTLGGGVQ
jgi:hypothetical protein